MKSSAKFKKVHVDYQILILSKLKKVHFHEVRKLFFSNRSGRLKGAPLQTDEIFCKIQKSACELPNLILSKNKKRCTFLKLGYFSSQIDPEDWFRFKPKQVFSLFLIGFEPKSIFACSGSNLNKKKKKPKYLCHFLCKIKPKKKRGFLKYGW